MKKAKFDISKKILIPSISLCLMLMGAGVCLSLSNDNINQENQKPDNEKFSIKLLSTTTNTDNSVTKTFSYSIMPENASDKSVTLSVQYKDGSDCSSIVEVSSNTQEMTISVTVKKDFDQQIILSVAPSANPSLAKQIPIDYEKKLKSLEDNIYFIQLGGSELVYSASKNTYLFSEWNYENEISGLFTQNYSLYTIDKTYSFTTSYISSASDEYYVVDGYKQEWFDEIGNYLLSILSEKKAIDKTEIWNLFDTNEYHSWLKETSELQKPFVAYDIDYITYCNEQPETTLDTTTYLYFSLDFDYTNFNVLVDNFTLSETQLVF